MQAIIRVLLTPIVIVILTAIFATIALWITAKISVFGIVVDRLKHVLITALIFAVLSLFISYLTQPITEITFGLFEFVAKTLAFGLSAWLVNGFRLQKKLLSLASVGLFLTLVDLALVQPLSNWIMQGLLHNVPK